MDSLLVLTIWGTQSLCLINLRSQLLSWWTSQGSDLGVVRPDVLYQQCAARDHEVNMSEIGIHADPACSLSTKSSFPIGCTVARQG